MRFKKYLLFFFSVVFSLLLLSISASYGYQSPQILDNETIQFPDGTKVGRWLPIDQQGWTILSPSRDSRLIYVSAQSGNDQTAQVYQTSDQEVNKNIYLPSQEIKAFKTIQAALNEARDGYPDWILLKRGDTFVEKIPKIKNGRSLSEPSVISSYGNHLQRPLLNAGHGTGIVIPSNIHYAVIKGIWILAHQRVWNSADYEPVAPKNVKTQHGIRWVIAQNKQANGLLIEDCKIEEFVFNLLFIAKSKAEMHNIVIRRNVIVDAYNPLSHSSGILATHMKLLLEENIFDHNGWRIQRRPDSKLNDKSEGQATIFNHNTYFPSPQGVVFRRNIFLRPSSIQNKFTANSGVGSARFIYVDNNLYIGGEIAISMGGNVASPLRFFNVTLSNNVITNLGKWRPTNRNLAWGFDILDWDGGKVINNLFLHQNDPQLTNTYAIRVEGQKNKGFIRDVILEKNIIYQLKTNLAAIILASQGKVENIHFQKNIIQGEDPKTTLLLNPQNINNYHFEQMIYPSSIHRDSGIRLLRKGTNAREKNSNYSLNLSQWQQMKPDQTSVGQDVTFVDSSRTIEQYLSKLGQTGDINRFIEQLRNQSQHNWQPDLTASKINNWFREGFTVVN